MARSRARPSTINRVLMDQTCFGRSGGLAPISFPLFHGVRGRSFERHSSFSDMSYSSVTENRELARQHARRRKKHVSFQRLAVVHGSSPVLGPPVLTLSGRPIVYQSSLRRYHGRSQRSMLRLGLLGFLRVTLVSQTCLALTLAEFPEHGARTKGRHCCSYRACGLCGLRNNDIVPRLYR